ncbi:hypothetical protein [Streptomyces sp. TBY4]|uniref:hypothetical protein n=1 Tax=Streptomyces sp. TBY4 TaxID=2962030 RepID=UPI0020B7E301|nr:hypothetical protein [Streptomyces sp. TBY4]MCP3760648.1 hypothetical protein [Streptomyces sp. TBY4]
MSRTMPNPGAVLGYRRDGRPIFPILGASSEDPSNAAAKVSFDQQQLQQLMAREKDQGQRSGARALVEKLGFTSASELEQFITQQREAEKAQLTEAQRREQDLDAREAAAIQREVAASTRERDAARRATLAGLGATGEDLNDAVALLRVLDDADDTAVAQAASELRNRRPELFTTVPKTPDAIPPAPGGSPASVPPPRPGGQTSKPGSAGLAMARRRGILPPAS